MAAPTLISSTDSAFNVSDTPKTVVVSVNAGDIIVVVAGSEDNARVLGLPTATGNTFTIQQQVGVANYCQAMVASCTAASTNASLTVSCTATGTSTLIWGFTCFVYRGSDGIGASAKTNVASGAPSLALTTTQANSAIAVVNTDWNASDGTTRTWRTVNSEVGTEDAYFRDAARYTIYTGHWNDTGATGAKTVGLSAPTGQKYSIVALEIKGSSSSAFSGSVALSGSGTLSFASIPTPNGDLALSGSGTLGFSSVPALLSSLALAGEGTLTFAAGLFVPGSLGLGGEGTLTFASDNFSGSLGLSGSGTLSMVGVPFVSSVLVLAGDGGLTFQSQPFIPAPAGFSSEGALSFLAQPNEVGTLALSGSGALSFAGSPAVLGAVDYSGSGTLAGGSGMTLVPLASIASATGWTATGGTVLAVLGDIEDSTLITSSDDPSNVLFDGTFGAIVPPSGAFTVRVRTYKSSATSGTLTGKLYVNTTLKSTVSVSIPDVLGNVYLVFPAGDLATITAPDWAAGVRITLAATAT